MAAREKPETPANWYIIVSNAVLQYTTYVKNKN